MIAISKSTWAYSTKREMSTSKKGTKSLTIFVKYTGICGCRGGSSAGICPCFCAIANASYSWYSGYSFKYCISLWWKSSSVQYRRLNPNDVHLVTRLTNSGDSSKRYWINLKAFDVRSGVPLPFPSAEMILVKLTSWYFQIIASRSFKGYIDNNISWAAFPFAYSSTYQIRTVLTIIHTKNKINQIHSMRIDTSWSYKQKQLSHSWYERNKW